MPQWPVVASSPSHHSCKVLRIYLNLYSKAEG